MKILRKNNIYLGILFGILGPLVAYAIFSLINNYLSGALNDGRAILKEDTIRMTSVFINLFIYLPYLNKKEFEMTGRGILLATFTGVILIFLTMV
jgi:hypothetical protein